MNRGSKKIDNKPTEKIKNVKPIQTTLKIQLGSCQQKLIQQDVNDCQPLWKIQDFQIVKQLGRGKFGYVYAARQKSSDYVIALKRMSKKQLIHNDFRKQVRRQIIIQSSLAHQNVLRLFGYFWDEYYVYLILEYAPGGQLFGVLKQRSRLSQQNVSIVIRQVCQGLQYLHSKAIIHRDIKPENLLVSLGRVKIADFGWSIHSLNKRDTLCGTLDYLAPEMVKGKSHDKTVDMWGVGVLAYELAVGKPPFQTKSYEETYQRILNQQVRFPQFMSYKLRQFIRSLLQKQPCKRPTVQEALSHAFLMSTIQLQLDF